MMRRMKAWTAALLPALLLAGCWDMKDVQEIGYVTALGFDHRDGQFAVYVQLLDFSAVAKKETAQRGGSPVWVGIGRGETIAAAINELYKTVQMPLFFGHVGSLMIGERLLKKPDLMMQLYEFKARNYELRYTSWIYGTREPIDKLFSLTSLYEQPPVMSILHQPRETFKQSSAVRPITMREFDIRINEVGRTALLPCLAISDDEWMRGGKTKLMAEIQGAFAVDKKGLALWLPDEDLTGLPWIEPESYNTLLEMEWSDSKTITLQLDKPKVRIVPAVRNGRAEYSVFVHLYANIFVDTTYIPENGIERHAAEKVRGEIEKLYKLSLKHNLDLLGLEESLYRMRNREWKMLKERDALRLTEDSLREINVTVHIIRSGKIKERIMMENK